MTTLAPVKVAPRTFLLLGALMQAPNGTLSRRDLMHHMMHVVTYGDFPALLKDAESRGYVVYDPTAGTVKLRETAEGVIRQGGRPNIPRFMRLEIGKAGRPWESMTQLSA